MHQLPNSTVYRYRALQLVFIQTELAFDTPADARTFLNEHGINSYQNPNSPDEDAILDSKPAQSVLAQVFEEKYRKVQIKGAV